MSEEQRAVLQRAFAHQRGGGEFALAIESYELLLSSIPPHPDILTNLGAAYAALGDSRNAIRSYEEARVHLEKALRIRPEACHVAYHLAQLWLMKGEPARARELLSPVVEAVPDFAEAHMSLAAACYRLGLREEGDRHRDAVIELKSGETH